MTALRGATKLAGMLAAVLVAGCHDSAEPAETASKVGPRILELTRPVTVEREEALRLLLRATEDDRVYERLERERFEKYETAALLLRPRAEVRGWGPTLVASTLARVEDPRARAALMQWVIRSDRFRDRILREMKGFPRPEYLQTARELLAMPRCADELTGLPRLAGYGELVIGSAEAASVHAAALALAAAIGDAPSLGLLRATALDRTLPSPDPRTLAALRCKERPGWRGGVRKSEAEALSSLRLVALALLADRELMRSVADDDGEPTALRGWARTMSRGEPKPFPGSQGLVGIEPMGPEVSSEGGGRPPPCR